VIFAPDDEQMYPPGGGAGSARSVEENLARAMEASRGPRTSAESGQPWCQAVQHLLVQRTWRLGAKDISRRPS